MKVLYCRKYRVNFSTQCRTRMFSKEELPYISRIRFNGSSPFCFRSRTKSLKILGEKLSTMELEKSKSREVKKQEGALHAFRKHGTVLFRSATLILLPRTQPTLCPPTSYGLNIPLARSFVFILYSESTFSQYRNRSRIGAWRCAIRRAGREIVLS